MITDEPFLWLLLRLPFRSEWRQALTSMVATSAAGCRKGGLPKMVRCRQSPQGESIRNKCARKSTNEKASPIQPGLSEHGPSDVPTTPQNPFPTSSGPPIQSTAQNELDTPHTLLFFLGRVRDNCKIACELTVELHLADRVPSRGMKEKKRAANHRESVPEKNLSGERGVARDAKYLRAPRDPAQDNVAAAR